MNIHMMIIGNELLSGKIADQNLQWLAKFITSQHWTLQKVSCLPDDEKIIAESLKVAINEADLVITSGGLGPTPDDLTKNALATFLKVPLVFNEKAYEMALSHYQKRNLTPIDPHHTYAFTPEGVQAVLNPCGLAPGLIYKTDTNLIFCAPGVPREFQDMTEQQLIPIIEAIFPPSSTLYRALTFKTQAISEEKIFNHVAPDLWGELSRLGLVSSLPQRLGVDIGVQLSGNSHQELDEKEQKVRNLIESTPLVPYIWHSGPESLSQLIVLLAQQQNITFSFAESCTGGLLSSLITDISGCSQVFSGSIVSYRSYTKENVLGVSSETISQRGIVSKETALEMAKEARRIFKTNIAISTTGLAGPGGGSEQCPVGTVAIGVCSEFQEKSFLFNFQGDRKKLKDVFALQSLFLLLQEIRDFYSSQNSSPRISSTS